MTHADDSDRLYRLVSSYAATQVGLYLPSHSSLFRYVRIDEPAWEFVRKTIIEGLLKSTEPERLNDPFDVSAIIANNASPDTIASFLRKIRLPGNPTITIDFDVVKIERGDGSFLSRDEIHKMVIHALEEGYRDVTKKQRLVSFCRRISSQLLWSHYAHSYSGLAYHFVYTDRPRSPLFQARTVRYERQRPIVLASEIFDFMNDTGKSSIEAWALSFQQRAYLTKSIEWAYEEENRVLTQDDFIQLSPDELASIIVGPKFSDDNLDRLNGIVAERKVPVPIYRAQLSKTDYAIEIDWSRPAEKLPA